MNTNTMIPHYFGSRINVILDDQLITVVYFKRSKLLKIMSEKYLITGSQGFIGSWIIKKLIEMNNGDGSHIMATDLQENNTILKQIISSKELMTINREYFDITNFNKILSLLKTFKPKYVIHLAGLQIPTCKAKPILGGTVNVIGTLTVFEAVKQYNDYMKSIGYNNNIIKSVVYASSAGICGTKEDYLPNKFVDDNDRHLPRTHYGVYKLCNEGNARIYFQDHNISSIGLRPLTVYGVGREVGLTSDVTKAIKASILGIKFNIGYTNTTLFHYVEDMANLFIKSSHVLYNKPGYYHCNIKGNTMKVQEFVKILNDIIPESKELITIKHDAITLPFPDTMKQSNLDKLFGSNGVSVTPVKHAILKTVDIFKKLHNNNALHCNDLKAKL